MIILKLFLKKVKIKILIVVMKVLDRNKGRNNMNILYLSQMIVIKFFYNILKIKKLLLIILNKNSSLKNTLFIIRNTKKKK